MSVIQSLCSHHVDRVYVTTDNTEIAAETSRLGANVIWRSVLHWDVCANPVFCHAIDEAMKDEPFDLVFTILPTSPLRMPYDLDMMYRLYKEVNRPKAMVSGMSRDHETIILELHDNHSGKPVLTDKSCKYGKAAGGFNITTPEQFKDSTKHVSVYDSEVDENITENLNKIREEPYYYEMEWWQQFEIDEYKHIPIVDFYMRTNILRDPDVYQRYKECDIITKYDRRSDDQSTENRLNK